MSNAPEGAFDDSLVSRLRVVEEQPLETRAAAFDAMFDELSRDLEGVGGLADPRASASDDR
jgi:hypothetical protein